MTWAPPDGGGDGAIAGLHPAIDSPDSTAALALYLENTNRPYINNASVHGALGGTIYVGDTSGFGGAPGTPSDATGDGTIHKPFATLEKAFQLIGYTNAVQVDVICSDAAPLPLPPVIAMLNHVTLKGQQTAGAAYSVTTVNLATEEHIDVEGTGAPQSGVDTFRGELYEWEGAPAVDGLRGWIRKSSDAGGALTGFILSQNKQASLGVPVATDDVRRYVLGTTLRLTAPTKILACTGLVFDGVVIDDVGGPYDLQVLSSRRVTFLDSRIDVEWLDVAGDVALDNAFVASEGDPNIGVLVVRPGGVLLMARGSVIDCGINTAAFLGFVTFEPGSTVLFTANCGFTDLDISAISADAATIAPETFMAAHDVWSFLDCNQAYQINSLDKGVGGSWQLPNSHGELSNTFAVVAHRAGFIRYGDGSSSLRTGGGGGVLNAVSANFLGTNVAVSSDGTKIFNGDPDEGAGTTSGGPLVLEDVITPATLAADADDYAPAGIKTANAVRLSASGPPKSITGIAAPVPARGQVLILTNIGPTNITLANNDVGSAAANRFLLSSPITLGQDEAVIIGYSIADSRWRAVSDF